jgi:hypothetical protein
VSALVDRFGELGGSLEKEIEAEVERRASKLLQAIAHEVQLQLAPVKRHQLTEKQVADDRHETLNRKLDQVLEKLGTNGSGGHA